MTMLYTFWQDSESRRWYPVGMLTYTQGEFQFSYTKGARMANRFTPFGRMTEINRVYRSKSLFPLFANRLLAKSRPEYQQYIRWIGAESDAENPLLVLGRTAGVRATDNLMVYAKPEPNEDGNYDLVFLCHGIRHLPKESISRVNSLKDGDNIYAMLDVMNEFDYEAVAIRTGSPSSMIGYVPRFFASDIRTCLSTNAPGDISFNAIRLNLDAPIQLRLLCRFTCPWPNGLAPCSSEEFEQLVTLESHQLEEDHAPNRYRLAASL